ncbi:unnamed protein product [Miscanthus lutarioriparius]|uniref:Uncharacterized protein n=1 Tax=Miscanthus lutarioriparius TaxID=422564 RepID=A0A811Q1U9_9POAL|nr:unnamed protein product [Miscanthus lutarioriparius]
MAAVAAGGRGTPPEVAQQMGVAQQTVAQPAKWICWWSSCRGVMEALQHRRPCRPYSALADATPTCRCCRREIGLEEAPVKQIGAGKQICRRETGRRRPGEQIGAGDWLWREKKEGQGGRRRGDRKSARVSQEIPRS